MQNNFLEMISNILCLKQRKWMRFSQNDEVVYLMNIFLQHSFMSLRLVLVSHLSLQCSGLAEELYQKLMSHFQVNPNEKYLKILSELSQDMLMLLQYDPKILEMLFLRVNIRVSLLSMLGMALVNIQHKHSLISILLAKNFLSFSIINR